MKKTVLALALTSLLAACGETPTETAQPTAVKSSASNGSDVTPAQAMQKGDVGNGLYPAKGVGGALGERSVYYDFDKFAVSDKYEPVVSAHGNFLVSHGAAKVTLQGNCDERGSREYNLGLGQRRADSVRKVLVAKGVKDSQIETVSFGKEKPSNSGHNAAAWTENRRTDIVYKGE